MNRLKPKKKYNLAARGRDRDRDRENPYPKNYKSNTF